MEEEDIYLDIDGNPIIEDKYYIQLDDNNNQINTINPTDINYILKYQYQTNQNISFKYIPDRLSINHSKGIKRIRVDTNPRIRLMSEFVDTDIEADYGGGKKNTKRRKSLKKRKMTKRRKMTKKRKMTKRRKMTKKS